MKSFKQYLPESFLAELQEEPHDSSSPVSGEEAQDKPDPTQTENGIRELGIGDPVRICKGVNHEGETGDIDSFWQDGRFVVVNLYNSGKASFHSSDVEYNDYDNGEDADEGDRELDNLRRLSGY